MAFWFRCGICGIEIPLSGGDFVTIGDKPVFICCLCLGFLD